MLKPLKTYLILTYLFITATAPAAIAEQPPYAVGIVKTPAGTAPAECYELLRDKKNLKPVQDMAVCNGDVIIPYKGKSITLIYKHLSCGEQTISQKAVVMCNPAEQRNAGWFMNIFSDAFENIKKKIHHTPAVSTKAVTSREPDPKKPDISCFPADELTVSQLPTEGATLLYNEPVLFRWENVSENISMCSEAKLIVKQDKDSDTSVIEKPVKIGQMIEVKASLFNAGFSYQWYVEQNNKIISDIYHFSILDKTESDNIRNQLAEVNKTDSDEDVIRQALYLQTLSDATPGLDLYTDSLLLLVPKLQSENEKKPDEIQGDISLLNEVLNRIYTHIDEISGIYPIQMLIRLLTPVPACEKIPNCIELGENKGPCAKNKYYAPQQTIMVNEIANEIVSQCSLMTLVLRNSAVSKSNYFWSLLSIDPDGNPVTLFPISDKDKKYSLIEFGTTIDLKGSLPLLLDRKGEETLMLVIRKDMADASALISSEDWSALKFSIHVK